jgi:prepilin-type N-terminal cleavage/methylation domain-containing protein
MSHHPQHRPAGRGFTIVELLVAVAILVMVSTITFGIFATVTKAWQRGTAMSQDLHHGDFVIEQLIGGLRQARYRNKNDGVLLTDNGDGPEARDAISWVKEGSDLVGEDSPLSKTFHRVKFFIGADEETSKIGAVYTAWGDTYLQPDDFDPEELPPEILSDRVVGFNVRVATNNLENDTLDWLDTWDTDIGAGDNQSNHVPRFVELTVYLRPIDEDQPPLEMKRFVDIPIANAGMK